MKRGTAGARRRPGPAPRAVASTPTVPARVGISGHRDLDLSTGARVRDALRDRLARCADPRDLVGVTALRGSVDLLFAEEVLARGGRLEVIVPARDFRIRAVRTEHAEEYDRLLPRATALHQLPFDQASREADVAAHIAVIERVELLLAVWNGGPSLQEVGTSHAVATAVRAGVAVEIVWPTGVRPHTAASS